VEEHVKVLIICSKTSVCNLELNSTTQGWEYSLRLIDFAQNVSSEQAMSCKHEAASFSSGEYLSEYAIIASFFPRESSRKKSWTASFSEIASHGRSPQYLSSTCLKKASISAERLSKISRLILLTDFTTSQELFVSARDHN
jgi:DNA-binding transcriptional regulator YdaS (Cro superfamily)